MRGLPPKTRSLTAHPARSEIARNPVPYEHGRLLHVAAALAGVWALSGLLGLDASGAHAGLRLGLVLLFPVLLAATGFFKDDERRAFKEWLLSAASSS